MITGTNEDWVTSNAKRKAHLRNAMSINLPKRPCHQEKWKVEFNDENEDLICDEEEMIRWLC